MTPEARGRGGAGARRHGTSQSPKRRRRGARPRRSSQNTNPLLLSSSRESIVRLFFVHNHVIRARYQRSGTPNTGPLSPMHHLITPLPRAHPPPRAPHCTLHRYMQWGHLHRDAGVPRDDGHDRCCQAVRLRTQSTFHPLPCSDIAVRVVHPVHASGLNPNITTTP